MGKFEARQRLTVVRRLCGQEPMGPSGVLLQFIDRTSFPISPPPTSQSSERPSRRVAVRPSMMLPPPAPHDAASCAKLTRWPDCTPNEPRALPTYPNKRARLSQLAQLAQLAQPRKPSSDHTSSTPS